MVYICIVLFHHLEKASWHYNRFGESAELTRCKAFRFACRAHRDLVREQVTLGADDVRELLVALEDDGGTALAMGRESSQQPVVRPSRRAAPPFCPLRSAAPLLPTGAPYQVHCVGHELLV